MKQSTLYILMILGLFFSSCDLEQIADDPLQVAPTSITLYVGEEYQIKTNYNNGVVYRSQDNWYASVSETGLVKGRSLGSTTIRVSRGGDAKDVKVKVESKYDLYPLMDNFIGNDISKVKTAFGTVDETTQYEGATIYWYHNYGKYDLDIAFAVETADETCTVMMVIVYASPTYYTALSTYIWDRYFCPKVLNDEYYLYNHDKTISLLWEYLPQQNKYAVAYYPYVNEYD